MKKALRKIAGPFCFLVTKALSITPADYESHLFSLYINRLPRFVFGTAIPYRVVFSFSDFTFSEIL